MVVFMASLSVAEAARRLGVSVPRIHQRIADGSLRAERIGSQWVVDELSVLHVGEDVAVGRPLSARSAWALIDLADGDHNGLAGLAPAERARAKRRLEELLGLVDRPPCSERDVRRIAVVLRTWFQNRASRELRRAAAADLPALREDRRWVSLGGPSAPMSRIGAGDLVEGYVVENDVESLADAFLLVRAERDANVIVHVLPEGRAAYPDSRLQLAADLAEHRGPREEARAVELLSELAQNSRGGAR